MPAMDLQHARTFVAVADLGTVSRAAVRLGVTQPALSRQIGAFERNSASGCSIASGAASF